MKKILLGLTVLVIITGCTKISIQAHQDLYDSSITLSHESNIDDDSNQGEFYTYINVDENEAISLNLKMQYSGDDWLQTKHYLISTDHHHYTIEPYETNFNRYKQNGIVWEYCEIELQEDHISMLYDIMNSNNVVVNYKGITDYSYTVTANEKFIIQNVLLSYEALKTKN